MALASISAQYVWVAALLAAALAELDAALDAFEFADTALAADSLAELAAAFMYPKVVVV